MRRVIIESPFAGKGPWPLRVWRTWRNVVYARACVRNSVLLGEAPIAWHLLFTQRGILKDHIPEERHMGIEAGLAWREVADASAVYIDRGISGGMAHGIAAARAAGLAVDFRSIENSRAGRALRAAKGDVDEQTIYLAHLNRHGPTW